MKKIALLSALLSLIPLASWAGKQIIILDIQDAGANSMVVNYLFWITTGNPIAHPNVQSRWSGASGGEVAAIQAGTVIEEPYSVDVASNTNTTALKQVLNDRFSARQKYFNQQPGPGVWYGIYYDSTTAWSQ